MTERRNCIPEQPLGECLEHTDIWLLTHPPYKCKGQVCTIHNRTGHNMRHFPQNYRFDRGIMERMCEHGVGHPDPDDYLCIRYPSERVHGCCGASCCVKK